MTRRQVSANHRSFSATEVGLQRPCGACSRAEKLHDWRHMVVMDFIKKLRDKARKQRKKFHFRKDADVAWGNSGRSWVFDPNRFDPQKRFQIQSLPDLSDLYSRCFKLGEFTAEGRRVIFAGVKRKESEELTPSWKGGGRRGRPNKPEGKKTSPFVGQLIRRAREGKVSYVRGYCRFCPQVMLSWKKMTAHKPCFNEHRGSSGEPVISSQEIDLLRRNYAWALRNVFARNRRRR